MFKNSKMLRITKSFKAHKLGALKVLSYTWNGASIGFQKSMIDASKKDNASVNLVVENRVDMLSLNDFVNRLQKNNSKVSSLKIPSFTDQMEILKTLTDENSMMFKHSNISFMDFSGTAPEIYGAGFSNVSSKEFQPTLKAGLQQNILAMSTYSKMSGVIPVVNLAGSLYARDPSIMGEIFARGMILMTRDASDKSAPLI